MSGSEESLATDKPGRDEVHEMEEAEGALLCWVTQRRGSFDVRT